MEGVSGTAVRQKENIMCYEYEVLNPSSFSLTAVPETLRRIHSTYIIAQELTSGYALDGGFSVAGPHNEVTSAVDDDAVSWPLVHEQQLPTSGHDILQDPKFK